MTTEQQNKTNIETVTASGNAPKLFSIKDCGDYFRVKWLDGLGEISCYTKDAYGFASKQELLNWIARERLV